MLPWQHTQIKNKVVPAVISYCHGYVFLPDRLTEQFLLSELLTLRCAAQLFLHNYIISKVLLL